MENVIEIKNLSKQYKNHSFQLGPIDLSLQSGRIIGLIGENGAGKTSLIKSMLHVIKKDSGEIKVFGKDFECEEIQIKEEIGVVLDDIFFPEVLNAKEIHATMKNIYQNWDSELFWKLVKEFNLPENKNLKSMSKGMRKKLEIVTALAHKPKLLILDEPTSGLDPVVRSEVLDIFWQFIKDEEHTILLSTHITSDLEQIADQIIFLDQGKIILNKSKDEIMDDYGMLKCDEKQFLQMDKNDLVSYRKNKYHYEVLVKNREKALKKYKDCIIDKITLEELMVFMIKGEKEC